MRKGRSLRELLREEDDGQAVLEYLLMLAVTVSVLGVLASGMRRVLVELWEKMARQIAAPCPGCTPPESVRIR